MDRSLSLTLQLLPDDVALGFILHIVNDFFTGRHLHLS